MKTKNIVLTLILLFYLFPIGKIFAQIPNVGFIPSNIWYSKDPFEEGDKIKIYTLLYNPDSRELSGNVIFFDNTTLLGQKSFKIASKAVKDLSIDWTVEAGNHTIFAKIENAKFLNSNGSYEEVYLAENKTEESKSNVPKKIITDLPNTISDKIAESTTVVTDVQKIVKDNTPTFITKAVDFTTSSLEDIRANTNTSLEDKKQTVQKEINVLNETKKNNTKNTDYILKPFKYLEIFFLTIFAFIFKTKILFFGLIVVILFLILRYIWRLIF